MDKRAAQRLATRIEREDPKVQITGYRRWPRTDSKGNERGARWEIDCVDTRSGITFEIGSPEQWDERCDDAKNVDELTDWQNSPEGRAAMDAYYAAEDAKQVLAEYLVATGDIAQMAGVTVDAVAQWTRRHPAFRALLTHTSAGLIGRRSAVEAWLKSTGRL